MAFSRRARRRETRRPASISEVLCEELLADPMVDVDELNDLLRDPSPLRVPDPPEPEDYDLELDDPEGTLARVARITGLVVAVGLLCGAVVAASALRGDRITDQPSFSASSAAGITGVRALVGFTTDEPRRSKPSVSTAAGPDGGPKATSGGTDGADGAGASAPQQDTKNGDNAALDDAEMLAAARAFYDKVGGDTPGALSMLRSDLLGSDPSDLERAWRSVRAVEVRQLSVEPDGMVRGVVSIARKDGQLYRVVQLLRIEGTPTPTITEARLLSSQRTPASS